MLRLKCTLSMCVLVSRTGQQVYTQHKTHEDGKTYLKTCGPGNSTATAQRTGARKLSRFCTVGTWRFMYLGAHKFMYGRWSPATYQGCN